MIADLRTALLGFDGKAISYLSETAAKYRNQPDYLQILVTLARDQEADIAAGATWLIKYHLETGGALDASLISQLFNALDETASWGGILHILQSVQYIDLDQLTDPHAFDLAHQHISHSRPFIRAWAVDAACRLAARFNKRNAEARQALDAALEDEAASVRARARKISKDLLR